MTWLILLLLGLGLRRASATGACTIGVGWIYQRFVFPRARRAA